MAQFCPACGAPLPGPTAFCGKCGAPVSAAPAPAPAPAKQGGGCLKIVLIVLAVVIVLGAIGTAGAIFFFYKAKEKIGQVAKESGVDFSELARKAPSARRVDPCTLLTQAEASRILGVTIERVESSGDACNYYPSGSVEQAAGYLGVQVHWEDGQKNDFDIRDLRLACRCAMCMEEMSGRALLDPKSVRPDVAPRTITSVGNYAITFVWNDGHSTGIYSFNNLRALGERGAAGVVEDV